MMTVVPEKIPADPKPAIARPIMKIVELEAAPQTREPNSKMLIAVKKTPLGE
jgi:hypothetical protein